ncbi:unnamed protein product [Cunninghamella blakesleeana]
MNLKELLFGLLLIFAFVSAQEKPIPMAISSADLKYFVNLGKNCEHLVYTKSGSVSSNQVWGIEMQKDKTVIIKNLDANKYANINEKGDIVYSDSPYLFKITSINGKDGDLIQDSKTDKVWTPKPNPKYSDWNMNLAPKDPNNHYQFFTISSVGTPVFNTPNAN